jgi:hypothetical protein
MGKLNNLQNTPTQLGVREPVFTEVCQQVIPVACPLPPGQTVHSTTISSSTAFRAQDYVPISGGIILRTFISLGNSCSLCQGRMQVHFCSNFASKLLNDRFLCKVAWCSDWLGQWHIKQVFVDVICLWPAGESLGGIHATVWYLTICPFQMRRKRPTRVILENHGCKFTHSWKMAVKPTYECVCV